MNGREATCRTFRAPRAPMGAFKMVRPNRIQKVDLIGITGFARHQDIRGRPPNVSLVLSGRCAGTFGRVGVAESGRLRRAWRLGYFLCAAKVFRRTSAGAR